MNALPHTFPNLPPRVRAAFTASVAAERNRLDRFAAADAVVRDENFFAAKAAVRRLTAEQRIQLAIVLVDGADVHAPDLKTETESCLSDLLAAVRGEG